MSKLSYQLYSSRNFPPLDATLKMVAELGYAQVEGYGALYAGLSDLEGLKEGLKSNGLHMASGHFGLDMLENEPDRVVDIARALEMRAVFCPHIVPDQRPDTGAGWAEFAKRVYAAGAAVRDAGIDYGWHNHDFEFVPTADGAVPMAAMFDGAPDLKWEADIAWIVRGGGDPLKWLDDHKSNAVAIHVKDIAEPGTCEDEDGWADVGTGTMDWAGIMKASRAAGVTLFVMEHDNPSGDRRFAKASFDNVSKL